VGTGKRQRVTHQGEGSPQTRARCYIPGIGTREPSILPNEMRFLSVAADVAPRLGMAPPAAEMVGTERRGHSAVAAAPSK
jgi:hypothetical protein